MTPEPAAFGIEVAGVSKTFRRGPLLTAALDRIDLSVADGEFLAVVGRPAAASRRCCA